MASSGMTTRGVSGRIVVGAMSGTSLDGIDAAAISFSGVWPDVHVEVVSSASGSLGRAAEPLRALAQGEPLTAGEIAAATRRFSERTATVMLQALDGRTPRLAAVHGQTVYHAPPESWQIVDAQRIAAALQCPVASHLRGGDLALGGQGAPITPVADRLLFNSDEPRAIVNLGGFCNITWLRDGTVQGADVCPCNLLLDAVARRRLDQQYDEHGSVAAAGQADHLLIASLERRLALTTLAGRALGSGDEAIDWLEEAGPATSGTSTLLASMVEAIAEVIVQHAYRYGPVEIVLAGGGARNDALTASIGRAAKGQVITSTDLGVPIESREAACMAILAALDDGNMPTTLPAITQRKEGDPISMQWCQPLRQPIEA